MKYKVQVEKSHYFKEGYVDENRMLSYSNQIDMVRRVALKLDKKKLSVLEIGVGNGVVRDILKSFGHRVTTLDIDKSLKPDIVASLPNIKLNKKYDVILACEVLEHIKFNDVEKSIKNLSKISDNIVISIPNKSPYLSFAFKMPMIKLKGKVFSLPFNFVPHKFQGEHYWELGAFGISANKFKKIASKSGLECEISYRLLIHPWHNFFLFTKKSRKRI